MPSKSAKKTAKKAVKKPRHPKKTKIPELITVGYSPKREFHVLFSDGATHIFKGESLDPTLHKQFIGHQADVLKGKLMIPYRGNTVQLTAKDLNSIRNPPNGEMSFKIDAWKFDQLVYIFNNFHPWFTKQLKKSKLNQAEITDLSGLSSATISWYAQGKSKPRGLEQLMQVFKAFKIDINKL
jgi:hypothetical protein